MKTFWCEREFEYDGSQLRPLFSYSEFGIEGDSVVAWIGGCDIPSENIVDAQDHRDQSEIRGKRMLHFIIETFHINIIGLVCLQRLVASMAKDLIATNAQKASSPISIRREGDDLFVDSRKLSISVASVSSISGLIHFALNVTNEGTPVPTCSLNDLGLEPKSFASDLLRMIAVEYSSIVSASQTVFPLK